MELIDRQTMLMLMKAKTTGDAKAISARANRIATANKFHQYDRPGFGGYWYDKGEVMRALKVTPLSLKATAQAA